MKTKRNRNALRYFFGFVMLSMMVLCFSCDNLFSLKASNDSSTGEEKEFSRNSKYTVSGNIVLKGALPAELIAGGTTNSKSSSIAKSAAPSTPSSITYTLVFTDLSDSTNTKTVSLTEGDESFSVELNKGTYGLSVTGCDSSGNEIVSGNASSAFTLSDTNKTVSDLTVSVAPISTGSSTGTVSLRLYITGCGIKAYKAVWTENDTEKCTTVKAGGADLSNPIFCMIEDGGVYPDDAPQAVGLYEVHFTFYNDYVTLDGSTEVFSCTEYISVFQNMQTGTWVNDANTSYISGGNFTLTPDIIEKQRRHKFYVDQANGNSTNEGSYFKPLDSVKTAVAKVCSQNDGAPYTIVLLSDDIDTSTASYTGSTPAYIQISPAANLQLTIEGDKTAGTKRTINANRSSANEGGVIYIGSNANVTIDNLEVTGGYLSSYNGGGIRNDGELHIKNCDVTGNTAYCGGGIYTCASLTINEALISGNEATAKGGGIYSENNLSAFDFGSAVCFTGNMASSGSAIYSQDAVSLVELLCTFDDDGDGSFSTAEKNTADDGTLMVFAGTSDATTLNFHSGFNMNADNSICIAAVDGSSPGDSVTQIHLAESLSNFGDSKKIKIVPSPYPTVSGIQVFSADSSLTAADEYTKFTVPDDNSGNEYKITDDGKISPVVSSYTDWEALVNAVAAIPNGTTTVTEFEIGSDMTMTSELLSDKPIRLYAKSNYTLTLGTSVTNTVFEPEAALTIEGVDGAQITFNGNHVSTLASFISLNNTAEATFKNITFTNFNASTDGSVVSVTPAASGCSATFADCNFSSNTTTGNADGGAIYMSGSSSFTFERCAFEQNVSGASGGALAVENADASAFINDCTFISNTASTDKQGGGIYVYKGACKINGVTMSTNSAGTFVSNDIYYYIPSANPELTLSGKCTIPAVYYGVANSTSAPSIMKIESLDTASSIGVQISLYTYTLTNEIIQSSDGTADISSCLGCFSCLDSYAVTLNSTNTGMYLTAITGSKPAPDTVGDIVFSDGSACAYTDVLTSEQTDAAVTVIFYAGTETDSLGKRVLGVGLKNSYGDGTGAMQWCISTAEGYYNLDDLVCEATTDSVTSAEFSGDLNGSDNWNVVQTNCSDTSATTSKCRPPASQTCFCALGITQAVST
ncbi:MAG: right-handed parallel beta-helix repeat-containing protein [Spirochaetia bacterium]|nr:right-handed parallel beta-helix repeat-containing protein [Spirochaetia bacterium]